MAMGRRTRWLVVLAAFTLLGVGGAVWHHKASPYHFQTVTPGRLYRSGTLRPHNLERVLDEFGIRTVVSLRTQGEEQIGDWYENERRILADREVDLIRIPVDEPPNAEHIAEWLDVVADEKRGPILVHCKHGVLRTAVMVGLYEIDVLGRPNREVVEELELFGRDWDVPHRAHLREFLLDYEPRPDGDEPSAGSTTESLTDDTESLTEGAAP